MTMFSPSAGNGVLPDLEGPSPVDIDLLREEIMLKTDTHEEDHRDLVRRMEQDHTLYRLDRHVNVDRQNGDLLPQYAVYTSNMLRTFADKIISWLTSAKLHMRVDHEESQAHDETVDSDKERFAIGILAAADERRRDMLEPSVRNTLAFYTAIRGGYVAGRALLVNRPDGSVYADITPWDPMHVHWGMGPDGLAWACHKIRMTNQQIREQYGVSLSDVRDTSTDVMKGGNWVYDYYDGTMNVVFSGKDMLKPPTPHGSPRVPVFATLIGATPVLQSDGMNMNMSEIGESVFAGTREVFKNFNNVMSIMLEIVERARSQTVIMASRGGRKTLDSNPFLEGTEISTDVEDKIYTLELQKMATETSAYLQLILGEIQRATLPFSAYGETPFQLSGFAITQLRQATETVLSSRLAALENVYRQVVNIIYDQFMTGGFEGFRLSGVDSNRAHFTRTMHPEMFIDSCDYNIELVSQLPQDDMTRWTMAKIADEGKFLSKIDILNDVVGVQDAQRANDKVKAEIAEQGLPEAQMFSLGMAAANAGNDILAKIYLMEYMRIMASKGLTPTGEPIGAPGGGGGEGPGGGQPPEVQPHAATGAPPEPETSNDGPSRVAPGTPRPGAQGQRDQ
jgi:hypothetical protein